MNYQWKSIIQMLNSLNELGSKTLILRNYELFEKDEFIKGHEDIDLLCDDPDAVIAALRAEQTNGKEDKTHLSVNVSNRMIPVDLRGVGDSYYDSKWEANMLRRRVRTPQGYFVLHPEDYIYSLLYHGIYHNQFLKEEYVLRVMELAYKNEIRIDKNHLKDELDLFMRKNGYIETGYRSK